MSLVKVKHALPFLTLSPSNYLSFSLEGIEYRFAIRILAYDIVCTPESTNPIIELLRLYIKSIIFDIPFKNHAVFSNAYLLIANRTIDKNIVSDSNVLHH